MTDQAKLMQYLQNLKLEEIRAEILTKEGLDDDKFDEPADSIYQGAIENFSQSDPKFK